MNQIMTSRINVKHLDNCETLIALREDLFSEENGIIIKPSFAPEVNGYVLKEANDKEMEIHCGSKSDLMMALGDVIRGNLPEAGKTKTASMDFRAVMLDVSRNAVYKVSFLKKILLEMALQGLNGFCLYTEDTFEVKEDPLIGYGRGTLTHKEIEELDAFGASIGVELFPCIQTLGHMEQIFKYEKYKHLQDNDRVINGASKDALKFIEMLIDNASKPYKSKRIHIGMDEAWGVGRGKSLDFSNPVDPRLFYARHIKNVADICSSKGLTPIIWADFIMGHSHDMKLSQDEIDVIPPNIVMNYWEYLGTDKAKYDKEIKTLKQFGHDLIVSPGAHTWTTYWGHRKLAFDTINAFLDAAHSNELKKAMLTIWGDDGSESMFVNCWAQLSNFLHRCRDIEDPDGYKDSLEKIVKISNKNLLLTDKISNPELPIVESWESFVPTEKMLFYDDPVLGFMGRMLPDGAVKKYFEPLLEELKQAQTQSDSEKNRMKLAELFVKVILGKDAAHRSALNSYKAADTAGLQAVLPLLPEVKENLNAFRSLYRKMWLAERRPFGLEMIESRIGGLVARIDSLQETIMEYLSDERDKIEEFEFKTVVDCYWYDFHCYTKIHSRCKELV
jgi:hypothetical protein